MRPTNVHNIYMYLLQTNIKKYPFCCQLESYSSNFARLMDLFQAHSQNNGCSFYIVFRSRLLIMYPAVSGRDNVMLSKRKFTSSSAYVSVFN